MHMQPMLMLMQVSRRGADSELMRGLMAEMHLCSSHSRPVLSLLGLYASSTALSTAPMLSDEQDLRAKLLLTIISTSPKL